MGDLNDTNDFQPIQWSCGLDRHDIRIIFRRGQGGATFANREAFGIEAILTGGNHILTGFRLFSGSSNDLEIAAEVIFAVWCWSPERYRECGCWLFRQFRRRLRDVRRSEQDSRCIQRDGYHTAYEAAFSYHGQLVFSIPDAVPFIDDQGPVPGSGIAADDAGRDSRVD